jgi:hypothetical protein
VADLWVESALYVGDSEGNWSRPPRRRGHGVPPSRPLRGRRARGRPDLRGRKPTRGGEASRRTAGVVGGSVGVSRRVLAGPDRRVRPPGGRPPR